MSVGSFIRGAFMLAALLATLTQILIDPSLENVASACIVLTSSLAILLYMQWSEALRTHPLSVFAIFGFCVTTQLGALLVQTVYWTPLRFSLYDSIYTFGTLAFYQAIALGVHAIYCYFSAPPNSKESWARGILRRGGLYLQPSIPTSWFLAGIGVLGVLLSGRSGILSKIGHGIGFLTWAPFLIPLYRHGTGENSRMSRQLWSAVTLYAGFIALVAIAFNGRSAIFQGALTVLLIYLLHGLRSENTIEGRALVKFGLAALVAAIALQPMNQVVAAMGAARGSRGKISPAEMVTKTYEFLVHPEFIRVSRAADPDEPSYRRVYDEIYLKNSLFGRFVETKFHDNAIHFGLSIVSDDSHERLARVTIDSLLVILPTPLLNALQINLNKSANLTFSMGDYLFYLARGGSLGGFKTGSVFGQGIALFGPLMPLIYAMVCLAIFHWMRLLTCMETAGAMSLSAVAMMNIWSLFQYGITAESLANFLASVVREFPQWILVYMIALFVARCVFGKRYARLAS